MNTALLPRPAKSPLANPVLISAGESRFLTSPSALPNLRSRGYALLPGLTSYIPTLSPVVRKDAWDALKNEHIAKALLGHEASKRHQWMLDDDGGIKHTPQPVINFEIKADKSHFTMFEGTEEILNWPHLPSVLRDYFSDVTRFIRHVRTYFDEILPRPNLPVVLESRIFLYDHSDPLVGMRPMVERPTAMRAHVDPSVVTLVVAESDGLLKLSSGGKWVPALGPEEKPFAVLIPGFAAAHDYGIPPTLHRVDSSRDLRISITAFLAPDLGFGTRAEAERRLKRWRLWHSRAVLNASPAGRCSACFLHLGMLNDAEHSRTPN